MEASTCTCTVKRQKTGHYDDDDDIMGHQTTVPVGTGSWKVRFRVQEKALKEATAKVQEQAQEMLGLRRLLESQSIELWEIRHEIQTQGEERQLQFAQQQQQAEVQGGDITELLQAVKNLATLSTNTFGLGWIAAQNDWKQNSSSPHQEGSAPVPSHQSPEPPSPAPCSSLLISNGKVTIPIRHDNLNPGTIYKPIEIDAKEYGTLRMRSDKATTFVRGLMSYCFQPEVLRRSNFEGSSVLTKDGHVIKDRLDRRVVMSIIDQAELEFPGQVRSKKAFSRIRSVINDKCRHS